MKQFWNKVTKYFWPNKNKKHVKLDLVFVIFFAVIIWRVATNLFTNAGLIPMYLDFWNHIPFWFTNILSNIMALFGLVLLFRIYIRSLKNISPIAEDVLKTMGDKIPSIKSHSVYKELCRKYNIEIKGE